MTGCQAANMDCNTNSLVSCHLAGGNYRQGKFLICYALSCGMRTRSLANFVGVVVGFLNVLLIRLVAST
jgi:hypothetical protein